MIIGQLTMGARQTKNAPLSISDTLFQTSVDPEWGIIGQARLLHSLHWVLLYLNLSRYSAFPRQDVFSFHDGQSQIIVSLSSTEVSKTS